jgi:hypothetical protein
VDELAQLMQESKHYAYLIDKSMREEERIQNELKEIEKQYQTVRQLLPDGLNVKAFEKQLRTLAQQQNLKIISSRTAVQTRPFYREAILNITLEGKRSSNSKFTDKVKSLPRIIKLEQRDKPGNKFHHYSITIFAADSKSPREVELPTCIELAKTLVLPPLTGWLAESYKRYREQCSYVVNYSETYKKAQRIDPLKEEVVRLQKIAEQVKAEL